MSDLIFYQFRSKLLLLLLFRENYCSRVLGEQKKLKSFLIANLDLNQFRVLLRNFCTENRWPFFEQIKLNTRTKYEYTNKANELTAYIKKHEQQRITIRVAYPSK